MPALVQPIALRIARLERYSLELTRFMNRRERFMEMIDWDVMTRQDRQAATTREDDLNLNLFETEAEIEFLVMNFDHEPVDCDAHLTWPRDEPCRWQPFRFP